MKPTDPSVPSPAGSSDDAWLESALRETARSHVTDNGFSAGVVGALPAVRRRPSPWRRTLAVVAGALLGGALAVAFGGADGIELLARAGEDAVVWLTPYLPSPDLVVLVAGMAVAATVIGVSNWRHWRSR